jgi:hypothetical protein
MGERRRGDVEESIRLVTSTAREAAGKSILLSAFCAVISFIDL